MKGGGLTWVGWAMAGVGAMLIYAGMTGTSLVDELRGVLTGGGLSGGAKDDAGAQVERSAAAPAPKPDTSGRQQAASRAVPWPQV